MQSQLCKICGERHHRYEPHRFPLKAAPEVPRSNVQFPIPRTLSKGRKPPATDLSAPGRDQSLDNPDKWPPTNLPNIATLDDLALRDLRNLVMAEVMRRTRASQKEPK